MRKYCLALFLLAAAPTFAQTLPVPNGDTRALFEALVEGRPFGQQTLSSLEPTLAAYCIALTPPNAIGDRTKIGDPISHRWTRVGFGEGQWVWLVQSDVYEPTCPSSVATPPPAQPPEPPPVVTPAPLPSVDLSPIWTLLATIQGQLAGMQATEAADTAAIRSDIASFRSSVGSIWDTVLKYLPIVAGFITSKLL